VYCIWLDEARARAALELAHAGYAAAAAGAGVQSRDIPDWEDPADVMAGAADAATPRAADPAERAAQVRAFLAVTGDAGEAAAPS
jgi:hypothetical protein